MDDTAAVVECLRRAGVELAPGLSASEITDVESRFGFAFRSDHRTLLRAAVPSGDGWVDWRVDSEADIRSRIDEPVEGLLFDVTNNGFWMASWGDRPADVALAEERVRSSMTAVAPLVPLYRHRYVPGSFPGGAASAAAGPVLSVHQSDVIYYGASLLDYVRREFGGASLSAVAAGVNRVPFWSDVVEGWSGPV